jgi:hypothetical protein
LAFGNGDVAVDGKPPDEALAAAAGLRPLHFQPVDLGAGTEAKHHAWVVRGEIAAAADFASMAQEIAALPSDFSTDRVDVGSCADEAEAEPVMVAAGIVLQEQGRAIIGGHKHVDCAIVVKIPESEPAAREKLCKRWASRIADIFPRSGILLEKKEGLAVAELGMVLLDHNVRMAVGNDQVEVAIVVEVKKLQPPAAHEACDRPDRRSERDVVESSLMVIVVERIHLVVDVGDEKIDPAVLIVVGGVDAHPGAGHAEGIVGHTGEQSIVRKAAPSLIDEQRIRRRIAADEKVHAPVVIDVGRDDTPGFGKRGRNAGFTADVLEGTVAIVMEEPAGHGFVDARFAVVTFARAVTAAPDVFLPAEVGEAADEEVQAAIVVVIEPDGARRPPGSCKAGLCGHVGKGAVAVIAIQDASGILGDVEIGQAVAVVIADRNAHAVGASGNPRLFGDVGKRAIPVVPVEGIAKRLQGIIEIARAAVDEVDVHPAVVVVIEESAAGADGFREKHCRRKARGVSPSDAAAFGRSGLKPGLRFPSGQRAAKRGRTD